MKNLENISDEEILSVINEHPLFTYLKTNLNLEAEDVLNVMKNPFFNVIEDAMFGTKRERKDFCKCQDPLMCVSPIKPIVNKKNMMKVERKNDNLIIKLVTTGYKNDDIKVDFSKKKQHIRITAKPNMADAFQSEIEEYVQLLPNENPKNIVKTSINGVTTIVMTLEKIIKKENNEYIHLS